VAAVRIERKKTGMATVARSAVKTGDIFQLVKKDGSLGSKTYVHVGRNGRDYSFNIENGELASTKNPSKRVTVVGKAQIETNYFKSQSQWVEKLRRDVRSGEIFQVKGGDSRYAGMGRLTNGSFASKNLNDPSDDDYAVTDNGNSRVQVIGTWELVGKTV
jgi:hypothetical protein